jgi:hypothetical protein
MVSRDPLIIYKYLYTTGRERKNFSYLAQILGPLPKAGARCSETWKNLQQLGNLVDSRIGRSHTQHV